MSVEDERIRPAVAATFRVPDTPAAVRQETDDSEIQRLASAAVTPNLSEMEYADVPKLLPIIET
eukprot:2530204-Rhodomonas_salina.2